VDKGTFFEVCERYLGRSAVAAESGWPG
jgi:hypothetical protein